MDTINSVQFSNHTGYSAGVRGQILDDSQLQELIDGLDANGINKYSHIINGYIGSKWEYSFNSQTSFTSLLQELSDQAGLRGVPPEVRVPRPDLRV